MARRRIQQALSVLPALGLVLAATACAQPVGPGSSADGSAQLKEPGFLTTCTHKPYQPFQFDQGGQTVGFDVDLVDLVAKDMGVKQKIFDTPFEGIQSGESLNAKQCDVAAAAMTITETRKKNMDFSDPYFNAEQALLVKKGAGFRDLASLHGKKIGVQLGTTGEEYANKNKDAGGFEIVQFEDLALQETAVKTGQVDAAINDNGVFYNYAKENPDTEVTTEFPTGDQYGIGVQKGNTALVQKINASLKKAKDSGAYDQIYEKWFGKKPPKN